MCQSKLVFPARKAHTGEPPLGTVVPRSQGMGQKAEDVAHFRREKCEAEAGISLSQRRVVADYRACPGAEECPERLGLDITETVRAMP